jgi:post-segregation antitoxin (ccd killing protein)
VVAGKEVLPVVEPESLDEAFGVFTHPGGIKPEPPLVIPPEGEAVYRDLPDHQEPPDVGAEAYRAAIETAQQRAAEHEFAEAIANAPASELAVKDVEHAILAVYGDVEYVQKTRAEQLNYSFAGEAAILAALRQSDEGEERRDPPLRIEERQPDGQHLARPPGDLRPRTERDQGQRVGAGRGQRQRRQEHPESHDGRV